MIIGIGSDLTDIRRIAASLERFGGRFEGRLFTDHERARANRKADRAASFAKRFAAKEACSKALGTGMRRGVFWKDMGVVNLSSGQPTLVLTGGAADRLAQIVPEGRRGVIHLSLTDDHPYAQAFVVIEALDETEQPPTGRRSASEPAAPRAERP